MKTSKESTHSQSTPKKIPKMESLDRNHISIIQQLYNKDIVCLKPNATILEAAKLMLEKQVGDIVIVEEHDGKSVPVGILTDRDIVLKITAKKIPPDSVKVSEVMTKNIITAKETDDLLDIIELMTARGVSRLPIVGDSKNIVGVLSSKKLYQYLARGLYELSKISVVQHQKEEKTH